MSQQYVGLLGCCSYDSIASKLPMKCQIAYPVVGYSSGVSKFLNSETDHAWLHATHHTTKPGIILFSSANATS